MDIQFDIVKSPGRQILPAYQEIHHSAVVEPQIPSVILIHLQQRNISRRFLSDLIEERHSQQLVSISFIVRFSEADSLGRQAGIISIFIYNNMSVKMLNIR